MIRVFLAAAALVSASACASNAALSEEPGFIAGYGDGCATGQEEDKSFSTKRYRDAESFEADRAYRSGWRQGYQQCKNATGSPNDGGRVLGNEDRF